MCIRDRARTIHPVLDLTLLVVLARFALTTGLRGPAYWFVGSAVLAQLAADLGEAAHQLTDRGPALGGAVDAVRLAVYLLFGLAAMHPSMTRLAEPGPDRAHRFSRRRLAGLGGLVLASPVVLTVEAARGRYGEVGFIAVASVAISVLVLARMGWLVMSLGATASSERTLRSAAADLAAAPDRRSIYAAAIEAAARLVSDQARVHLAMWSAADVVATAFTDGADQARAPAAGGQPVDGTGPAAGRQPGVPLTLPELDAVLNGPGAGEDRDQRHTEVLPILVLQELVGAFVLLSDKPPSPPLRDAVDALGSQLGLALERLALSDDLYQRRGEARFRSLVHNSSDVITVLDTDSTVRYHSPSLRRVLGYDGDDLLGTRLLDIVHPTDVPLALTLFEESPGAPGDGGGSPIALRARRADGSWVDLEAIGDNLLGDPNVRGIVVTLRDVSDRKALERTLTYQTFHDSLTGLANRALFSNRVDHALARRDRRDFEVAVLVLDLDDFKTVNDSLGHAVGDELLEGVAARLGSSLRPADTTARLGGDEFAVLLEDMTETADAMIAAQRLLGSLRAPFTLEGKSVEISASIGIAVAGREDLRAENLVRNADIAMYLAKSRRKGSYEVFEARMHEAAILRLDMKADLQRAVDHGDFVLHYQPLVALDRRRVVGFEALVRWEHPVRGLLGPADFIPLAEETNLIVPLGSWVLEQACRQARSWYAHHGTTMSVNLSRNQLARPELEGELGEILARTGAPARAVTLEITESAVMHDVDRTVGVLHRLRGLGVRVAIDDFGTGYSSLAVLRHLPIDELKIDKAFVDDVGGTVDDSMLVSTVIDLAKGLGLDTVAEGIEHESQVDRLREMECPLGQGYFFARPLPAQAAGALLQDRPKLPELADS